jgi:hypothetical protein
VYIGCGPTQPPLQWTLGALSVGVHAGQILLGHSNEMGKGCGMCRGQERCIYGIGGETRKKKTTLNIIHAGRRILLTHCGPVMQICVTTVKDG